MIQHYNRKSFYFGIPGIALQFCGEFVRESGQAHSLRVALGCLIIVAGIVLLIIGFSFYAKAKGRHPAWCLVAFLSIVGLLILALLKDKSVLVSTEVVQESEG